MGVVENERALQMAAERFADNMEKYPIEEQLAVGAISKNVLNGCSWEFVRTNPDIRRNLDKFKANPNCSVQEVTYDEKKNLYGYLLYMKMDYLLSILSKEANGLLDQNDLMRASEHRQKACVELGKLMMKKYKGTIGIYCTNNSQTITVDGKTYPAYAVSMREFLQICLQFGYGVVVNGKVRDPQEVAKREDGVVKKSVVAPSSNALFINIAPMR